MPYDEFLKWSKYFELRPIDWRNDLRASYLMQAAGVKKKPQEIFPSLLGMLTNNTSDSDSIGKSLQGSFIFKLMQDAKDGVKIPV